MKPLPKAMYRFLFVKFGGESYEPTWNVDIRKEIDGWGICRVHVPDTWTCECRCGRSFRLDAMRGRVMLHRVNATEDNAAGIQVTTCESSLDEPPCSHWKPVKECVE
ncbi:hypothetical protein O4273_26630 [Rhodococcus ruber]|uniref:hypothetical protein n=1 Tax=Rhodococcus ruber TaxID=1830 RepID=UPI0022B592B9|nr:hypothetical protein [Rhodococcus ruber]MCZ4506406.1 hypothetical protein [Rhodococcus ruber]